MISWLFTAIALIGTYFNAQMEKKGFYFWLMSNAYFSYINFINEEYAIATLFAVYFILAIEGIRKWI